MNIRGETSQGGVAGVFSRAAPDYDSHGPAIFAALGQRLVEVACITPGAKVLDVASGRGAVLLAALDRIGPGGEATGIELADNMFRETSAEIERSGRQNIEIRQMDAEQLDFSGGSFDFVLCGFALWLFPQPHRALQEFYRVLKPGGTLALTTWSTDSPFLEWARREITASLPLQTTSSGKAASSPTLGSANFGTPEQIVAALRKAGFMEFESHMEEHDFIYANDEEWWASLWGHGLRSRFETLDVPTLEIFKSRMICKVQTLKRSDGIHTLWHPLFCRSVKPS